LKLRNDDTILQALWQISLRLFVVYPGTRRFELDDNIIASPLTQLPEETATL
jgi:hypothetical protein